MLGFILRLYALASFFLLPPRYLLGRGEEEKVDFWGGWAGHRRHPASPKNPGEKVNGATPEIYELVPGFP